MVNRAVRWRQVWIQPALRLFSIHSNVMYLELNQMRKTEVLAHLLSVCKVCFFYKPHLVNLSLGTWKYSVVSYMKSKLVVKEIQKLLNKCSVFKVMWRPEQTEDGHFNDIPNQLPQ
ncbi:hypothetical protein ILYODFUR_004843 [Ilyodon furcidens]|uniref:Uncharacterized protein n=1 Tax=Ilyodon furcidens TaxID=33524 RepID=A0ABV0U364_9TELE